MALVRILVDGYNLIHALSRQADSKDYSKCSLLHSWPELAAGAARHSEAARDALAEMLTQYQDAVGTPVTIFLTARARDAASRKIVPLARWRFCFPITARRRMI